MHSKKILIALAVCISFFSCKNDEKDNIDDDLQSYVEPEEVIEFGFNLNDYVVKRDTIKNGDSFGTILERNSIGYPRIFHIAESAKESFDIRKLQIGKPYTLLCSKDSLQTPECFIYQPNSIDYVVIKFADSIITYNESKPVTVIEKELDTSGQTTQEVDDDDGGLPGFGFLPAIVAIGAVLLLRRRL